MKYHPIVTIKDRDAVICRNIKTGRKDVYIGYTIFEARQLFKKLLNHEEPKQGTPRT